MAAYDFETGEQIWAMAGGGDVPVPTPLFHDGIIFITNGHGRSPIYAVSQDATGDLTPTQDRDLPAGLVWYESRSGSYIPTPIVIDDLIYTCNDGGVLVVREATTGKEVYRRRVSQGGDTFSASAVASSDHIYFSSESGQITVIRKGGEFEPVASNEMGAIVMATPAIFDGCLFVRTVDHLFCIANRPTTDHSGAPPPD
jgi:outer membrane protein assembly factor BamB